MYELGIGVAFLCWVAGNVLWVAERFSTRGRNLRKLGMKLSLWGQIRPMTASDVNRPLLLRLILIALWSFFGLVLTLFSWGYVIAYVGGIAWQWSKRNGAPQEVREFNWRMRNTDMSFDDIIRFSMRMRGIDEEQFEAVRRDTIEDMRSRGVL